MRGSEFAFDLKEDGGHCGVQKNGGGGELGRRLEN